MTYDLARQRPEGSCYCTLAGRAVLKGDRAWGAPVASKSWSVTAKKTLWLWWSGRGMPALDVCFRAYLLRFDI